MKDEEYRENLAHYLPREFKLGLGLQDRYAPFKEREDYLSRYFVTMDPRATKSLLTELKEEYARKGMRQVSSILSESPEILGGAFSNLRRLQIKPTRRAVLSREEPDIPREIMEDDYILEEVERDDDEGL